jgi:transposase
VDVVDPLDLGAIYASYDEKDGRGQWAYVPEIMVRVSLYGHATGVYSSRKIEARTYEDVAFRYLSSDQHPDDDSFAEFRKRRLEALAGLFTQALLLCERAGLVKLGHVAIDGSKIKAKAGGPSDRSSSLGWNKGSFVQGYNAQAAVDATAQVIVAAEVTQQTTGNQLLLPLWDQVEKNLSRKSQAASAGAGYWSEDNAADPSVAGIGLHIATGRDKHKEVAARPSGPPPRSSRSPAHSRWRTQRSPRSI